MGLVELIPSPLRYLAGFLAIVLGAGFFIDDRMDSKAHAVEERVMRAKDADMSSLSAQLVDIKEELRDIKRVLMNAPRRSR